PLVAAEQAPAGGAQPEQVHAASKQASTHGSEPPDLDDGGPAPAATATDQERDTDDEHHRSRGCGDDIRTSRLRDSFDVAAQLAELGLDVVAIDLLDGRHGVLLFCPIFCLIKAIATPIAAT